MIANTKNDGAAQGRGAAPRFETTLFDRMRESFDYLGDGTRGVLRGMALLIAALILASVLLA